MNEVNKKDNFFQIKPVVFKAAGFIYYVLNSILFVQLISRYILKIRNLASL